MADTFEVAKVASARDLGASESATRPRNGDHVPEWRMARIEWARLSGDDVEHVVAVMIARDNPLARRVRPSRGDRGIDIILARPDRSSVDVYQVKSFALNLGSNEKRQITKSFRRLSSHASETGLSIANWYLVLPLDPTLENTIWFNVLTTGAGFDAEWRGLIHVEGLAAKYPDVIDYYLRDGKARLQAAVSDLTSILRRGSLVSPSASSTTGPLTPNETRSGLLALHAELNRYDPHYRYDFSVDTFRPEVPDAPLLVCAAQLGDESAFLTFKIFARYLEATDERPVPVNIRWRIAPDSETAEDLREWTTYGTPFEAPLGSADLAMDLPGGLGGEVLGAGVTVGPANTGEPYQLRAQVVAPSGAVLAACRLEMNPVTIGLDGIGTRASGQEKHGVFSMELRFNTETQSAAMSLGSLDITGRRPSHVLAGIQFLAALRAPNKLRFALPYGPPPAEIITIPDTIPEPSEADMILRVVQALASIQEHTAVQITIPDFATTTQREAGELVRAARLLSGESVPGKWDTLEVRVDPAMLAAGGPAVTVMWQEPFRLKVGSLDIDLGLRQIQLIAAKIEPDDGAEPDIEGLVKAQFHPLEGNRDLVIRHVSAAAGTGALE